MMLNMWCVIGLILMLRISIRVAKCWSEVNMCWNMLENVGICQNAQTLSTGRLINRRVLLPGKAMAHSPKCKTCLRLLSP
jgi:hypothetical protein